MGQRLDQQDAAWQLPQGGIENDEDPKAAALRELKEETGVQSVKILAELEDWLSYDLPHELVNILWAGKYRGQKQKWFAMLFIGNESEIDPLNVKFPEFRNWRWAELGELPHIAVPFKRGIYTTIAGEFSKFSARLKATR